MLGSPAGPGGGSHQRGLWPLAPAPPPIASDAFGKCGVYSLFPGGPTFGSALYSHARTIGQFTSGHLQQTPVNPFYHKDSIFSSTGYTFGAPTPPPGSPYSPVPVTQLELLTKGFNSNIIIHQQSATSGDFPPSPKKLPLAEKRCDEKCCSSLNKQKQQNCDCPKRSDNDGCSRTNPIEWSNVNVKKEPCQVPEITTSHVSPVIKLEVTSPRMGAEIHHSEYVGNIPAVGIAVPRQRYQHQEMMGSPSLPPAGLLTTVHAAAQIKEMTKASTESAECTTTTAATATGMAASANGGVAGGAALLQCSDERNTSLAGWPVGGTHGNALGTPTLWQCPAPVPVEPILPVPMPPVGFQLVRDPTTGGLLLLPTTTGIEPLQQTLVWPNYHQSAAPSVLLPPLPPPPLQLLGSTASDYLSSSTTLHQHTQSTRLLTVTTGDTKRKIPLPLPATTLIKIETDATKTLQSFSTISSNTGTVFTDQPLLTTHVIYQHPNLILSQPHQETICRSQATSPVSCLTPPPEVPMIEEETSVQDASNQTEIEVEDTVTITEIVEDVKKPDLSGLELLSSLVELETKTEEKEELGGLDLLCALAEQRIIEAENDEKERKKKRKSKHRSQDEPEKKKKKKKYAQMDDKEVGVRMQLADLQRQYREKRKELHDLKPEQPILKPAVLCAFENIKTPMKHSDRIINDYKNDLLREEMAKSKHSSSKKRKVGRPKKLSSPSGLNLSTTETIVAKKPKTSNFVGYLLAAKEKFKQKACKTPPRYVEEHKTKKNKNNNDILEDFHTSKIRPKLKAEPTLKTCVEEEEEEDFECAFQQLEEEVEEKREEEEDVEKSDEEEEDEVQDIGEIPVKRRSDDQRCLLTGEHLEMDKLRVLTAMGGLFYAGNLNAVQPPDVYSITLDGERGNRPHIMSREEILRDAIVEVPVKSVEELTPGTRLCAYWSQQYRCLYPGSVAEPGTPDPVLDSKFVAVEFDDGDSGRIAIDDIRLLPPDYPIIEYDPNPLLSLSKRKRRTSASTSTEERKVKSEPVVEVAEKENTNTVSDIHHHNKQERKKMKKRKREKLRQRLEDDQLVKKKRRKHKCADAEHCKHKRHHKKHRKHKKHHHHQQQQAQAQVVPAAEDEDTADGATAQAVINANNNNNSHKTKKIRDRQESCESRSKMSAFLPARQLWSWSGKGYKRFRAKGKSRKIFYRSIQRGKETVTVGDSAVFLSTGRPDRPYIGKIQAMWELCGTMVVKVNWFYHPEETVGCPANLKYPGALFESPHFDENDVQTISHKCEVLPLEEYRERLGDDPHNYTTIYENNDIYYLAGYYDPTTTTIKMEQSIPFVVEQQQ